MSRRFTQFVLLIASGVALSGAADAAGIGDAATVGWLSGWEYRQEILVSPALTSTDLSGFPMLIEVADPSNHLFSRASSGGHDIVFTAADGETVLPREIERFSNVGSQEMNAWVRTDISPSDPTRLYMYYGGAHVPAAAETWDANFKMVSHMSQDPSGPAPQMKDSSQYGNSGTSAGGMTSENRVPGPVDGSLTFDGVDDFISIANDPSLNTTDYTIEMWVYNEAGSGSWPTLLNQGSQSDTDGYFWIYTTGTNGAGLSFQYAYGDGHTARNFPDTLIDDGWQHVVFTFDHSTGELTLYAHGVPVSTEVLPLGTLPVNDAGLFLGTYQGSSSARYPFLGRLDEVRISDIARCSDWIAADYNVMHANDTYVTFGSVEAIPEPSSLLQIVLGALCLVAKASVGRSNRATNHRSIL